MLNSVSLSDTVSVSPQIRVTDVAELARLGFRTIINNRPDGEDAMQPTGADIAAAAAEHGLAYHSIPITASSLSRADVDAFTAAVAASDGPVFAYCRSGTRCCLLWSLGEALAGHDAPGALTQSAAAKGFNIASLAALFARMSRR
ncbi:MAG: TIGR01244 family phosphatase [Azospirillum sp.]|nr:TIGR01244 family phosphatase [Azospirillum sp.]